jgi:hypothetical protein
VTDQVVDNQALDLGALRELCEKARAGWPFYRDGGWAQDYADDVSALLAEVERLRAERDTARELAVALEQQTGEALRIAREALPLTKYAGEDAMNKWEALRNIQRVLGVPDDEEDVEP